MWMSFSLYSHVDWIFHVTFAFKRVLYIISNAKDYLDFYILVLYYIFLYIKC